MVVASGTAEGEGKEDSPHRINLLVDDICTLFDRVLFGENLSSDREETGGGNAPGPLWIHEVS